MRGNYEFYITPEDYEIAKRNGICRRLLDARIRELGWDKETAITKKPKYNKELKKYIQIAKLNGIKEATFLTRVRKLKWEVERACTEPVKSRKECAQLIGGHNRKYSKEVYITLDNNRVDRETFRIRMKKGWTLEAASTRRPMTKAEVSILGNKKYREKYGHSFGFDLGINRKVNI